MDSNGSWVKLLVLTCIAGSVVVLLVLLVVSVVLVVLVMSVMLVCITNQQQKRGINISTK